MDVTQTTEIKYISFKDTIELLSNGDSAKRQIAVATLVQAGRQILPHLVAHAADPSKSAPHRVRILKVIKQVGYPNTFAERGAIYRLTYAADSPPPVRKAAGRLIRDCLYDKPAG